MIDCSKKIAKNQNYELSKNDVLAFEEYGKIESGAFSDWSHRWPSQDDVRNLDENGVQQTSGSPVRAIAYLPEAE